MRIVNFRCQLPKARQVHRPSHGTSEATIRSAGPQVRRSAGPQSASPRTANRDLEMLSFARHSFFPSAFSLLPSLALDCAARRRRRDLAAPPRWLLRSGLGPSLPARRHHSRADHTAAGVGRRRRRRAHRREPAAPVHHPGGAVRLCERHRLADRHGLPVRARLRAEPPRRADRLPDRPADRRQPAGPGICDRLRRPGDGADDPVQHCTGRRHSFPDYPERRPRVRFGAGTDRRTHRAVPHAGSFSRRPDRFGDVPHRHGAESPRRGARAAERRHRGVMDAVGDGRGRARSSQPGARAVGDLPPLSAGAA